MVTISQITTSVGRVIPGGGVVSGAGDGAASYGRGRSDSYRLLHVPGQILKDLLLALLDFEQNWLRHASVVLPRMDLARLQEDLPQIGDTLLHQ